MMGPPTLPPQFWLRSRGECGLSAVGTKKGEAAA